MILYNTKYLQLKSTATKSGTDWVYAHRPNTTGVVVILPIIENSKILFLIEERPPLTAEGISKYSIGFPAGLVGDERQGESTENAIKAELLEEAGLAADEILIEPFKIASSPGCVSECVTIAIAKIKEYNIISEPINDDGIIINRVLVDKNDAYKWLIEQSKKGYAITASALAAMFMYNEENK